MSSIVHIGKRQLSAELICEHVSKSHLLPQLLREIIIDEVLAQWEPSSPAQLANAEVEFEQCYDQIATLSAHQGMNQTQLMTIAARTLKLQQFKQGAWGNKLGSYYLARKSQLDRVVFSVIQVENGAIAQELFFRVQSGEKPFAELAFKYSQGPEARDGGKLGPIAIALLHPEISRQVIHLSPGRLSPLFTIDNFYIFVRLEEVLPAQFDDNLRQFLLDELFEKWLQERIANEIGLVSVESNAIAPDFSEEQTPTSLSILTPAVAEESGISPDLDREKFVLERGDTGLLLSQLGTISLVPPTQNLSSSTNFNNPPLSAPKLVQIDRSSHPNATFFAPQTTTPIAIAYIDDTKSKSDRQKSIIILIITVVALIAGCGLFYHLKSTELAHPKTTSGE